MKSICELVNYFPTIAQKYGAAQRHIIREKEKICRQQQQTIGRVATNCICDRTTKHKQRYVTKAHTVGIVWQRWR